MKNTEITIIIEEVMNTAVFTASIKEIPEIVVQADSVAKCLIELGESLEELDKYNEWVKGITVK